MKIKETNNFKETHSSMSLVRQCSIASIS